MSLRGQTQSVADDPGYVAPSYAGRRDQPVQHGQYVAPPQPAYMSPPAPSPADVRYYQPSPPTYRTAPRPDYQQQAFAVPPPVDRYAIPEPDPSVGAAGQPQEPVYNRRGWARWMGPSWRGHRTVSGEMFKPELLTGAHHSLPLPSFVYVTNLANNRTVLVRINDRIPAASGRVVIVSETAARLLEFKRAGRAEVEIQYAGPASPDPNSTHEVEFLRQQPWYRGASLRVPPGPLVTQQRPGRYPPAAYPRWDATQR